MRAWWAIIAIGCGGDGDEPGPASEDGYAIRAWDDTSIQCTDPAGAPTPLGGNVELFVARIDAALDVHACFVGDVDPCGFPPFDARAWLSELTLHETATDRWTVTHGFTTNLAGTECATDSETITMERLDGEALALRWKRAPQVITQETCETTRTDIPEVDDATPCVLSHYVEAAPRQATLPAASPSHRP